MSDFIYQRFMEKKYIDNFQAGEMHFTNIHYYRDCLGAPSDKDEGAVSYLNEIGGKSQIINQAQLIKCFSLVKEIDNCFGTYLLEINKEQLVSAIKKALALDKGFFKLVGANVKYHDDSTPLLNKERCYPFYKKIVYQEEREFRISLICQRPDLIKKYSSIDSDAVNRILSSEKVEHEKNSELRNLFGMKVLNVDMRKVDTNILK